MIDSLFGSKTRVKLLHLFLNNPGKAFYVREITRLIDEQINSVRRELANMLEVGIITSDSADNKLYYEINQRYEHYTPFRGIFAVQKSGASNIVTKSEKLSSWETDLAKLSGLRIAIIAGVLVNGSASAVDMLIVGNIPEKKVAQIVSLIEKDQGRELRYSVLSYDEFYYRLSVRDKFINDILTNKHQVLVDTDNILKNIR
ncbi:transcriptional regulator [Microbacteriaceae bacterium]|nr:transcriptional regulator [Candidatus Saccharibacteria bacterium]